MKNGKHDEALKKIEGEWERMKSELERLKESLSSQLEREFIEYDSKLQSLLSAGKEHGDGEADKDWLKQVRKVASKKKAE